MTLAEFSKDVERAWGIGCGGASRGPFPTLPEAAVIEFCKSDRIHIHCHKETSDFDHNDAPAKSMKMRL